MPQWGAAAAWAGTATARTVSTAVIARTRSRSGERFMVASSGLRRHHGGVVGRIRRHAWPHHGQGMPIAHELLAASAPLLPKNGAHCNEFCTRIAQAGDRL